MFVAPKWPALEQHFQSLGYALFKEYPIGKRIYTTPNGERGKSQLMGIPWPVQLWYDPPHKEAVLRSVQQEAGYGMHFLSKMYGKDI
jgi:hypothetical protein